MKKMLPPLKKGTFVGIYGTVGAFPIINREAPGFYNILLRDRVVLVRRSLLSQNWTPGIRVLFLGEPENFITLTPDGRRTS